MRAVLLREGAWHKIDGETVLAELGHAAEHFPEVVQARYDDEVIVIVDYEVWKSRVRAYQQGG